MDAGERGRRGMGDGYGGGVDGADGESRLGRRGRGERGGLGGLGLGLGLGCEFVRRVLSLAEWERTWCASAAARTTSAVMLEMRGSVLMRMSLLRESGSGWVRGGGGGGGGSGGGGAA